MVPVATTTTGARSGPASVSTLKASSSAGPILATVTPVLSGQPKASVHRSMYATKSSRGRNPSGSGPSYSAPGRRMLQLGVTRQKLSQRRRVQLSPTSPRSRTTWSTPCSVRQ